MTPAPADRLHERLSHLGADGLRSLDAALERAQARARIGGQPVRVPVEFEVSGAGIVAVEVTARFERRDNVGGGAT